jgi:hypothetical protein
MKELGFGPIPCDSKTTAYRLHHASLTNLAQKVVLHSTSYQQEGQKVVNVEADDWYMKIHCNHVQIEIILKKIKVLMLINVMADF